MPEDSEPLSIQGAALLDTGRALDAVEVLRQGVAAGEPSAPDLLVRAYFDSASWRAAVDWLGPLVEQGYARFAGRLGVALLELGDDRRAETALRLGVDSGDLAAANDLAILLRDGDRPGEAVQVLSRAAEAGDARAAANLVQVHLETGDLPSAVEVAERFADEARPDTVVALAEVRTAQGETGEAEVLYRRAVTLGAARAHTAYGWFLTGTDPAGAERAFREAGRHDEPGWAFTLARFLLADGRPEEARGYLQLAADGGDPEAVAALAELDGEDPGDD